MKQNCHSEINKSLIWQWGSNTWFQWGNRALNGPYLAVAKMCSYLGDHRTDRTSALWPKWESYCLLYLCIQKWLHKCLHLIHWPCRIWIFDPDLKSHSWILGFLVPTAKHRQSLERHIYYFIKLHLRDRKFDFYCDAQFRLNWTDKHGLSILHRKSEINEVTIKQNRICLSETDTQAFLCLFQGRS